MIFFLMTIAGSIPVLACLILLCFKRDSFSVRFELLLLKMGLFFFLVPIQKLWLSVPEPFYNFVNSLFSIDRSKTGFQLTYHHIQPSYSASSSKRLLDLDSKMVCRIFRCMEYSFLFLSLLSNISL